jgi:hypothetical protein
MAERHHNTEGDSMAERGTIEERMDRLERQAELNRQGINALIDLSNALADMFTSALGQFRKIPKLPRVGSVVEEGDDK